jgi:hypothetical protein
VPANGVVRARGVVTTAMADVMAVGIGGSPVVEAGHCVRGEHWRGEAHQRARVKGGGTQPDGEAMAGWRWLTTATWVPVDGGWLRRVLRLEEGEG